ncbi:WhiB family transcriptional regulator [Lentzea sp. PSKA42]|uniref:Transcriptional regulator WhiB n=1 Tax=Lentzea indica TaxID=2604800 RepID=A0ABX1FL24_9PSEU|nr:WhiB family transcriptional regulator [Lentzea indica]NKE59699.1 WhiB family transcriptional regulator [Lentzea indica]
MSEHGLIKYDGLYHLLSTLPGADFGGRPACADEDPELFFPESGQVAQISKAKSVCASCPILTACLSYALHHGVQGVWGGTSEEERRAMRRADWTEKAVA